MEKNKIDTDLRYQDPCADVCQALWFTTDEVNVTDQCVNDVDLKTIDADDVNAVDTLDDDDDDADDDDDEDDEDDDEVMTEEEMTQARKAAKKDKWLARKHAIHAERRSKKLGAKRRWGKHNNMGSSHFRTYESREERIAHHRERETIKGERKEQTTGEKEARKEQRMEANSEREIARRVHQREGNVDKKADNAEMLRLRNEKWAVMKAARKVAQQASRTERKENRPEDSEERIPSENFMNFS